MNLKGQTRDPNTLRAQYLENYLSYRLQIWYAALYLECLAPAQIIFPESGRGLGHVTPTIFGSTVGYPIDSLASCYYVSCRLQLKTLCYSFDKRVTMSVDNKVCVHTWGGGRGSRACGERAVERLGGSRRDVQPGGVDGCP